MSATLHRTEGSPVFPEEPTSEMLLAGLQCANRNEVDLFVTELMDIYKAMVAIAPSGWQPIETAPEGVLLVVGWLDAEDEEHPERHDFDYLEDGVWQKHSENVEYFQVCAPAGSRGPKEQAPYTHFMPMGSIPPAPNQGEAS